MVVAASENAAVLLYPTKISYYLQGFTTWTNGCIRYLVEL